MSHAQHDPILAATDVEDPEPSMPSAGGQRKRTLPFYFALCLACFLSAALAFASSNTHSPLKSGERVGLAAPSDDDAIWSSVTGAATIEQLQEQVDAASGDAKAALQEKLDKLKEDLPDWEQITSTYSGTDAWDGIKSSARVEELEQAVEDAKAAGSDKLDELQQNLASAQAAVPSAHDIKEQASTIWKEKADELPDLGDIRANVEQVGEDLHDSVNGMMDNLDISSWSSPWR